jgi:hypothetical protein
MLSEAKHLAAVRDRPFAALRVTTPDRSCSLKPIIVVNSLGALGTDQPGQRQGDQDDEPGGGVDPERLDLRKDQDVLDQCQQDDTGEGTNHPPAAAFEGDSSNNGSCKD